MYCLKPRLVEKRTGGRTSRPNAGSAGRLHVAGCRRRTGRHAGRAENDAAIRDRDIRRKCQEHGLLSGPSGKPSIRLPALFPQIFRHFRIWPNCPPPFFLSSTIVFLHKIIVSMNLLGKFYEEGGHSGRWRPDASFQTSMMHRVTSGL